MKRFTLALVLLAACSGNGYPRDPGYVLTVKNHHPDDVVVYLEPSNRRLGRLDGMTGTATWRLDAGVVRSGAYIMVCVGNRTPTNRLCFATQPMTGSYGSRNGITPGEIFLTVMSGVGGIAAILNG